MQVISFKPSIDKVKSTGVDPPASGSIVDGEPPEKVYDEASVVEFTVEASRGSEKVVFTFDNTYSKITSKHVLFGAEPA